MPRSTKWLIAVLILSLGFFAYALATDFHVLVTHSPSCSEVRSRYERVQQLNEQIADLEKRLAASRGEEPAEPPDDTPESAEK